MTFKTPWTIRELSKAVEILDANGKQIQCAMNTPHSLAIMGQVITAVNAHDALVAACEAATEWFQRNGEEYAGDIEVYNQLRAALLKAKGGAS